jgi:hypothetical protein
MRGKPKRNPELVAVTIRVPPEMRAWLDAKAKWSTGSMGSEATRALREVMDRELREQRAERKREAASS